MSSKSAQKSQPALAASTDEHDELHEHGKPAVKNTDKEGLSLHRVRQGQITVVDPIPVVPQSINVTAQGYMGSQATKEQEKTQRVSSDQTGEKLSPDHTTEEHHTATEASTRSSSIPGEVPNWEGTTQEKLNRTEPLTSDRPMGRTPSVPGAFEAPSPGEVECQDVAVTGKVCYEPSHDKSVSGESVAGEPRPKEPASESPATSPSAVPSILVHSPPEVSDFIETNAPPRPSTPIETSSVAASTAKPLESTISVGQRQAKPIRDDISEVPEVRETPGAVSEVPGLPGGITGIPVPVTLSETSLCGTERSNSSKPSKWKLLIRKGRNMVARPFLLSFTLGRPVGKVTKDALRKAAKAEEND